MNECTATVVPSEWDRCKQSIIQQMNSHTMFHNFILLFPKQRTYRNHPDAIQKKIANNVVRWVDLDFNLNEDKKHSHKHKHNTQTLASINLLYT